MPAINPYEVSPDATYISLHPRNVARLNGNVTAAYIMQFFIDQCRNDATKFEDFQFTPVTMGFEEIQHLTGIGWSRITTALKLLQDKDFLTYSGNYAGTTVLPNLTKLTAKAER